MTSKAARPSEAGRFPIIGIGASAGGIPALEGFFKGLDGGDGMAIVVVTHLSPDRESMLHEVIARYTELPVHVTEDGASPRPGNVYVMPQNAILTIEDGQFEIRRPNAINRERKPIDIFFAALAKDKGEYAAGVVLSGGDGDGTLGIKAIKEHGGLTLAQIADGSGPRNPDMPAAAIGSGLVDLAIPAEEMGARLIEFTRSFEVVDRLEGDTGGKDDERSDTLKSQEAIYRLLRSQAGHDFSGYKSKTFLRRVHRRMQVVQTETIEGYVERLGRDPAEVMHLFRDLLINVTNFFRDREAFQALAEQIVPKLFEGRDATDTIRIWVPGCATGEEVYSLGILMREHMATLPVMPRVQIFATDIDDAALSVARAGRYPAPLLEGVSPERLRRFFSTDGASYVVNKDVRELCIFSPHSVIRDPPFSRMDMVSCRNLLIYFGPDIQHQVVPTFHYALKPGGYLFLGTSESITQHADLFATIDKKHRIFQSREHASEVPRLPIAITGRGATGRHAGSPAALSGSFPLRQAIEAHVLERFAPAHVVVNGEGDVVYYSAGTGRFLEAAPGAPNRQLLAMARKGLRLDLRAAMREAIETGGTVTRQDIIIDDDTNPYQPVSLTIEPLAERGQGEPLYLVLFTPLSPIPGGGQHRADRQDQDGALSDLEQELRDTRERLQSTIEEYETALEELKSSNEELVSVNEESQSTNEELEASKEEMQSLNEELNTINAELGGKLEDLDRANNDLRNLFESTQIATIFLDRKLVIRNFTPAASTFFNLRGADIGRPLTELASYLVYPELKENIQQVFESGEPLEHQISRDANEAHYLVRLIPYRDEDKQIEGVVVTFVDVTRLAEAEDQQRVLIAELNHRVKNMLAVVISLAAQTRRGATTLDDFASALAGRLQAMARAYGTLSRENWHTIAAGDVIRQELEPFGDNRVIAGGEAMSLPPQAGLSLSMVMHELATNATKYGALSKPSGQIEVSWSPMAGRPGLHLVWSEQEGPAVKESLQEGFGLRLIRGEIEHRHGGSVNTEFRSDGLRVTIDLPFGIPTET